MEEHMKHIDDLFKEELGGYAEMPPPPAWGALEKRLEEDKRRRAFPYRWLWVVGLLAFVTISGYGVANKLAGERMAGTGPSLPVRVQSHISAGTTNEQSTASPKKQTISASSIAKTSVGTSNNITHHKKHTKHTSRNVNGFAVARENVAATAVETLPATVKTANASSQYPSEEDVYEGAVASTAPLAYESTTTSGYTVNRRQKHNMVVADMSPVPEEQKHYASTTKPSKIVAASTNDKTASAETTQTTRKTRVHAVTHTTATVKAIATSQPKSHTIKSATKPMVNAIAMASATPKIKTSVPHQAKALAVKATTATAAAPAKPVVTSEAPTPQSAATTNTKNVRSPQTVTATTAIASASATNNKQASRKPTVEKHVNTAQKVSSNMNVAVATSAPAPISRPASATKTATNTQASAALKNAGNTVATTNKTASVNPPAQTASAHKSIEKTLATVATEKVATTQPTSAKQSGAEAPVVTKATIVSTKQSHTLAAAPSKVNKGSTRATQKSSMATTAVAAAQPTATTAAAIEQGVTPAKTSTAHPTAEKNVAKTPAKHSNHSVAKATASVISTTTAVTTTAGNAVRNKQKNAKSAPVMLAAKASAPKAESSKNQPTYQFTPSIEDDAPTPAIDNLRTESTVAAAGDAETPIPGTFKASISEKKDALATQQEQKAPMTGDSTIAGKHKRLEAGIKAGFEGSIMSGAANKFVISPYIDYKLSSKFSVLLQPAIKSSMLATHSLSGTQSYYNVHPGDSALVSSAPGLIYNNATHTWDTAFTVRKYGYQQSHDSVVKSYNVGGTYFEFELPILLKYAINEKLSVYGGVNIAYSRMVRINEKTFNSGPIMLVDTQAVVSPKGQYVAPPTISATFAYSGQPLGNYAGPLYPASSEGLIRLGYMLGFSYEFKKRWMLDALVQQCFAKPNDQGGYNTNTALSLPYMRLTLGYKLTK
jgi:hypothetical protein